MLARGPLDTSLATRPRLVVAERSGTPRPVGTVSGRTPLRPLVPEAAAVRTVAVAALGTVTVAALRTVTVAALRTIAMAAVRTPVAATIAGIARVRTARGAGLIAAVPLGAGPSATIAFRGEPASVPSVSAGLPAGPFPATARRARSAIARPAPVSG
ncbi:MAG TPA: hypothetical protein VNV62_20310 [Trebonia sp.]|nr:hypothetical protein [Trebonia sp.]